MKYEVLENSSTINIDKLNELYQNASYVHYMHQLTWDANHSPIWYYLGTSNHNKYVGFAKVLISQFNRLKFLKSATINFGPIFTNAEEGVGLLFFIIDDLQSKGFYEVNIQMAMPVSNESEYIAYELSKKYEMTQMISEHNWSTVVIPMNRDLDTIWKELPSRARREINICKKKSLSTKELALDDKDIDAFKSLYIKMYEVRGIVNASNKEQYKKEFDKVIHFDGSTVFGVYDEEGVLLGAVHLIKCGRTIKYHMGAADPEVKGIPVLYKALWSVVEKYFKDFECLDLGGYDAFAKEGEQKFNINKFKTAFSKQYVFYPRRMNVVLNSKNKDISGFVQKLI